MKQFGVVRWLTDQIIDDVGAATIARVIARPYGGISTTASVREHGPMFLRKVVVKFWSTPERVLRQNLRDHDGQALAL